MLHGCLSNSNHKDLFRIGSNINKVKITSHLYSLSRHYLHSMWDFNISHFFLMTLQSCRTFVTGWFKDDWGEGSWLDEEKCGLMQLVFRHDEIIDRQECVLRTQLYVEVVIRTRGLVLWLSKLLFGQSNLNKWLFYPFEFLYILNLSSFLSLTFPSLPFSFPTRTMFFSSIFNCN